jgi:5-methylcytosine-specific restriction endonuclease McrA
VLFKIDFLESHDEASLIAELQRIARERGTNRLTAKDIDKYGLVSSPTLRLKFGSLRHALTAAGLEASYFNKSTDAELIREVANLWMLTMRDSGRRPRAKEVAKYGLRVSSKTISDRFGSWKKALATTARAMNSAGNTLPDVLPVIVRHKRKTPTKGRRFDVFKRDGYICKICRKPGGELEVDHIVPLAKGGANTMDNLQTVCRPCNRSKGTKLM